MKWNIFIWDLIEIKQKIYKNISKIIISASCKYRMNFPARKDWFRRATLLPSPQIFRLGNMSVNRAESSNTYLFIGLYNLIKKINLRLIFTIWEKSSKKYRMKLTWTSVMYMEYIWCTACKYRWKLERMGQIVTILNKGQGRLFLMWMLWNTS